MSRRRQLWITFAVNMLLRCPWTEVPADQASDVQRAVWDELGIRTQVMFGTNRRQRRLMRLDTMRGT